jgi:MFS family permease
MHAPAPAGLDRHAAYNKSRLFLVSVIALFTAGLAASLRSAVATDIQRVFLDPIDPVRSETMIGSVLGVAFLGFAFTIAIGSPLLDKVGMSIMLPLSGVCFLVGTLLFLFTGAQ